jgi:hypothetical protein
MNIEINMLSTHELWKEFRNLVKNLWYVPSYFRHAPEHEEATSVAEISPAGIFTAPIVGTQKILFQYVNEAYDLKLIVSRQLPSRWFSVYFKNKNEEEEWFFHENNKLGVKNKARLCVQKIEAIIPVLQEVQEKNHTNQVNK